MDSDSTFSVNEPGVISEVIEGEAIILNFESGTYYSLNDSFQLLWQGIGEGLPLARLTTTLKARYPDAGDDLQDQVTAAIQQLLDEQLIVASPRSPAEQIEATSEEAKAYQAPQLHKYTDLQELLLLDPIHDVDESGQAISNG